MLPLEQIEHHLVMRTQQLVSIFPIFFLCKLTFDGACNEYARKLSWKNSNKKLLWQSIFRAENEV